MKILLRRLVPICLFILSISICSLGQTTKAPLPAYLLDPAKKINQYNIDVWTTNEGLPSNSLLHIAQSKEGYLWISGYNGLVRFDGNRFVVFTKKNAKVLSSNVIGGISESSDSTLWITTQGSGVVRYKNGQLIPLPDSLKFRTIHRGILADTQGRIWASSPDTGWFYIQNNKLNTLKYNNLNLSNIEIRTIEEDQNGTVWLGTLGHGLFKYQSNHLTNFKDQPGLVSNWIYAIFPLNDREVLLGTSDGLSVFDGTMFKPFLPEITASVTKILRDGYENLWFATIDGLYRWNTKRSELEHLTMEHGLPDDFIVDMTFDFEGNLWLTHYKGGLSRIKDGKFTNYTSQSGLPGKVVNAICETAPNQYIVGFDNGVAVQFNGTTFTDFPLSAKYGEVRIRNIIKDKHNNLWFSTYSGIIKQTPDGRQIWMNEETGFPATRIRVAFEDSKGRIWVGSRNNGLIRINIDGSYTIFNMKNGLSSNMVMAISEDQKGAILVCLSGNETGFNIILPNDKIEVFGAKEGFYCTVAFNTYTDTNNTTWIACRDGLYRFKDWEFERINAHDGMPEDAIFDIVEDSNGFLWMPTSIGILKVSKKEVNQFMDKKLDQIEFAVLDQYDGMKENECNPSAQVLVNTNGHFLFPTLNGFSEINANEKKINEIVPPVKIESIVVDQIEHTPNKTLKLDANTRRITFTYTALSLYEPRRIQFKYRLVGFDDEWTEVDNLRSVSYTNLPHGTYTFQVLACNNDGIWNKVGDTVTFVVKAHFWETWFFYLVVIIGLTLAVWSIVQFRTRQLAQRQVILEQTIRERTSQLLEKTENLEKSSAEILRKNEELRLSHAEIANQADELSLQKEELKNLNDFKDQIFRIIAHDLRAPLGTMSESIQYLTQNWSTVANSNKLESWLRQLNSMSLSTFSLLDNLMNWSLDHQKNVLFNPKKIDAKPLIEEVIQFIKPIANQKNVNLHSDVEADLGLIADENMLKTVIRNLTSNAVKFTESNGDVTVSAKRIGSRVQFSVTDTGAGMEPEFIARILSPEIQKTLKGSAKQSGSGLGLLISKAFLQQHNSQLHIESKQGQGSQFWFEI